MGKRIVSLLLSFGLLLGAHSAVSPIVVAAELAEIQERGYLIVAVKDNWRPLGFRDASGELVGFEIDIAHRLAEELLGDANAVVLQPVANRDRLNAVLEEEADLAIAGVTASDVRRRLVAFSQPYYLDSTALITRSSTIQTLPQASLHPIALIEGSSAVATVRSRLPQAQFIAVSSYEEAKQFLDANPEASFAGDITVLSGWMQDYPEYRILPALLSVEPLAVVMPKGIRHAELQRQVNQAIERWHESGWIEERAQYWGLP